MTKPHLAIACTQHRVDDVRMFQRWTQSFAKLGWRVTHIAPASDIVPEFPEGAEFFPISSREGYLERVRLAGRVLPHLEKAAPDLVLFPDPELFPVLRRFSRRRGIPIVFDRHENFESPGTLVSQGVLSSLIARAYVYYEWWATPRIAGVIVVLEEMIRNLNPKTEARIAHNFPTRAVVEALAGEARSGAPRYTCVNLGAMHVERGLYEQLEVARMMVRDRGRSEFRFCLGGKFPPGTLEPSLEFVRRHGLEDQVTLVESFLPHERVVEIYRGATIGFSPYLNVEKAHITLQSKILEFMAAGLPIITSPSSMNGRVIEESGCGALYWASETDAICDRIEEWMDDPERARAIGRKGKAYLLSHLNWESDLAGIAEWFEELTSHRLEASNAGASAPDPV